jgi:hypothetical protein
MITTVSSDITTDHTALGVPQYFFMHCYTNPETGNTAPAKKIRRKRRRMKMKREKRKDGEKENNFGRTIPM